MRFFIFLRTIFPFILVYSTSAAIESRFSYSDLIPNDLSDYLYDYSVSEDKYPNFAISDLIVSKSGSLPMIEDFISGNLDICILALPDENEFSFTQDENLMFIPFGYKTSVLVVNAENPISEITIDQLSNIFCVSSAASNLLSWRDLGLSSFNTSSIKAYAVKEDNGISSDLFRHTVLREKLFNSSVTFEEEKKILNMVIQDKAAIGVVPRSPKDINLKVLFIAKDDDSIAYGPSIENIFYSDYPIYLPFYIVFNKKDAERLFPLISILLSDSVASILDNSTFYALPKLIREKLIIDLLEYIQNKED